MSRLAPALLAVLLVCSVPSTSAFSASIGREVRARTAVTALNYHPESYRPETLPETYDRALDCANNFGMCGIDELLDLSEELDEFLECYVEDGPEACEKEIDDRHGLSEALLVQSEMREHDRYIQEGNLFPFDASSGDNQMGDGAQDDFFWGGEPPALAP